MRAVQPLATQQAADLARLATAVRFLDDPQSILGREPAAGRLGENLRVRSAPSRRGLGPGGAPPRAGVARGYTPLPTFGSAFIMVPLCRPLIRVCTENHNTLYMQPYLESGEPKIPSLMAYDDIFR